ncbi:polysaccharide biosynthesis/export family protein [Leptolyngbya sp. 'hensonii']|uniref:polysaccharide biosynthesis/export family protein n=1 Tax=Leptolyngbya sp. 'hensonii' TaxID=1922337 RepID=UPI00209B45A5|nr:polysaccharide biosynthesis/export family protein [Leptolyngbya sp. 'hensonii']
MNQRSTPLPPNPSPTPGPKPVEVAPPSPAPVPAKPSTGDRPPVPSRRPTTLELLEEARQRLRERGELPTPGSSQTPTGPSQLPVEKPKTPLAIYRLGIGDTVTVTVQRFTDLSTQSIIDPEGKITMPLLGRVPLEGLSLEEARERIRTDLDRYIIDPIVTVALAGPRPVQVTIVGEVSEPGFYALSGAGRGVGFLRISTALLAAGGTTDQADLRAVKIRRPLLDGSFVEQTIDLFTPLKNGDAMPDLNLQDRDVVVVPRLTAGAIQDYDRDLVSRSTLAQPLISIRILSYPGSTVGVLRLNNGSTFLDALTAIGPNPDVADLGSIALVRFDPEQGKAVTRQINGESLLRGDISQNVPLQNNDVIIIGRNLVAQITYALGVFTQPFRDILGFLLFFDSLANSAGNLFRPTGTNR